jgi:AraC-like DNA-binding protein
MGNRGFLTRFPQVATRRLDQFEPTARRFSIVSIDVEDHQSFDCRVNSFETTGVLLTYGRYGSAIKLRLAHRTFYTQGFPISGAGEVSWGRHSRVVNGERGGLASSPGVDTVFEFGPGFSHLHAIFTPQTLTRKLSNLLGQPIDRPIEIDSRDPYDPAIIRSTARLARFLADELDSTQGALPATMTEELTQGIVVGFLLGNRSNYSGILHRESASVSPRQVQRTIDFLEEHWDQPITIELLSNVAGTSARNLFHTFRRSHGMSPMRYVRGLRLHHAQRMLAAGGPTDTVTSIAYGCGFSNLGYFAREYSRVFGERPSSTLARSRSRHSREGAPAGPGMAAW